MSARTILTLVNGHGVDLLNPLVGDIDFAVIAEQLAKEKRYNGATPEAEYSVAQHCALGAAAILASDKDEELAGYFLLHDAHEAFLKDDTTPKKNAIAAIAQEAFGVLGSTILEAFDLLTYRFDVAVHVAAGLAWPPTPEMQAQIKHWDLRLFVTEWRDLMGNRPHPDWTPYQDIAPLSAVIRPVGWEAARASYLGLCREILPSLRRSIPRRAR
jgi:hypothetical protein